MFDNGGDWSIVSAWTYGSDTEHWRGEGCNNDPNWRGMKTIAELKRRRDGLNDEIARREAEHNSYLHTAWVRAARARWREQEAHYARRLGLRQRWDDALDELLIRRQAEALTTIPVRTPFRSCIEAAFFIDGPRHGQILPIALGAQSTVIDGCIYNRLSCRWTELALFVATKGKR